MQILFWSILTYVILALVFIFIKQYSFIHWLKQEIKAIHHELCIRLPPIYTHKEVNIVCGIYVFPKIYCKIFPNSKEKLYLMDDIIKLKSVNKWKIEYFDRKTVKLSKYFFNIFIIFS